MSWIHKQTNKGHAILYKGLKIFFLNYHKMELSNEGQHAKSIWPGNWFYNIKMLVYTNFQEEQH